MFAVVAFAGIDDALAANLSCKKANQSGTNGNDVLIATLIGETINGKAGNDVITGSSGDDRLCGQGGNDILNGLDGDDFLKGGDGNDILTGDALDPPTISADTYQCGEGIDVIIENDGVLGNDTILDPEECELVMGVI